MSQPTYLYKILADAPPAPLPESLALSGLDQKDGFIHLSIAKQTPLTARMFFANHRELWVLRVSRGKLDGRIEWFTEPTYKIEGGCPHLHESAKGLGRDNVAEVIHVARQTDEDWAETEGMKRVLEDE